MFAVQFVTLPTVRAYPESVLLQLAFLPSSAYLSSHVTYNWRLRGQLFLPEILLTGHFASTVHHLCTQPALTV